VACHAVALFDIVVGVEVSAMLLSGYGGGLVMASITTEATEFQIAFGGIRSSMQHGGVWNVGKVC
jgi:hypothetical protein